MLAKHLSGIVGSLLVTGFLGAWGDISGTNIGSFHDYPLSFGLGACNVCVEIPGGTNAFSYLFLKVGNSAPTDLSWDFLSMLDGNTNSLALEKPELTHRNFFLRVFTPEQSQPHEFTVRVTTNVTALRTLSHPLSKWSTGKVNGSVPGTNWDYFSGEVPSSLQAWRVTVSTAAKNRAPDLYLNQANPPG